MTVAVIGIRGRGTDHISNFCNMKSSHNVRLKTLCDVDEKFWDAGVKSVLDKTGTRPQLEWDMRKVFDDKEIDAVSMATPNHWHALGSIWACQAGKHVYVEKPSNHNIWKGRKMIEAARKYNTRVQVGFQNRSIANVREAMQFLHDGGIGDVYMARGTCIKPRDSLVLLRIVNLLQRYIMIVVWDRLLLVLTTKNEVSHLRSAKKPLAKCRPSYP